MIFAPVEEVRVYRNGAVVRRKAALELLEGINEVILSGLSGSANPDSLRLFFSSGITGKDVQILPLSEAVKHLPSEMLDDEIEELESRIEALDTVKQLWISNGNFETRGEITGEIITSYLNTLPSQLEKLRAEKRALEKQLEELKEKKEEFKKREAFLAIRLVIDSPKALKTDCVIEYTDISAQWTSTYEIHTTSDSSELKILSRARITQNTGEDWENVRLSLYTGNPTFRQDIPVLKKLSLQFKQQTDLGASLPSCGGMVMDKQLIPTAPLPVGAGASFARMVMEDAQEIDADTMTGYSLPGKRTVTSGNVGTMADIKTDTISAEKRIIAVPKLDESAYLAAMIKTEDWPLKPSSAKIYLNENYCGEVRVDPDMTEDIFMLSLGKDERISLSREVIRSKTEDVMLRAQHRSISEYAIRVANNSDKPLTVIVWDQIPVSTEKQISVDNVTAEGASIDNDNGKLNWNLTVDGKATVEKRLSYIVTYPKDKVIREITTNSKTDLKLCSNCGAYSQGTFCTECGTPFKSDN